MAPMEQSENGASTPDIFEYLDYRLYLKDWFDACKSRNPRFSYRTLARDVGYSSHAFFSMIIQGRSNISMDIALRFAETIGLPSREKDFFLTLVRANQEAIPSQRRAYYRKLHEIKGNSGTKLRADQNAFLSSWRHAAVRELLGIEPFHGSAERLGRGLCPPATAEEVRSSLDLLLELGLVHRTTSGLARTDPCLVTGMTYSEEATRAFMRQVHELGGDALDRFARDERFHGWTTLSVSEATVEVMRTRLRELIEQFLQLAEKDPVPDRVMQLNLELFPLARGQEAP